MFRRGKEGEELWPTPTSVGCIGKGEGERGNRKGRGSQVAEAKLGSQDNSEKADTSLPGASGDRSELDIRHLKGIERKWGEEK